MIKSHSVNYYTVSASIAQWIEQQITNLYVESSSLSGCAVGHDMRSCKSAREARNLLNRVEQMPS